jgi:hypothetical protein
MLMTRPATTVIETEPRPPTEQGFRARVVLIGASNVTRGMSVAVETARLLLGAPLDVHFVAGRGRSYGLDTFVVVRSLPSVRDSAFWSRLDQFEPVPTYGLIADVGNDLMYGIEPQRVVDWVVCCIDALAARDTRLVIAAPPLARLSRIGPTDYLIARTLLFPRNRMPRATALERAEALHRLLHDLARDRNCPIIDPPAHWYGADPIHLRLRCQAEAWSTILGRWTGDGDAPRASGSVARWLALHSRSPERWRLFGRISRGRLQPCLRLADGTTVSLW